MSGAAHELESLLAAVLRPIEPPGRLPDRVEETLTRVADAAAEQLSAWVGELSEGELAALRDPRNWVRPVVAITAGSAAAGTLLVLQARRRRASGAVRRLPDRLQQLRRSR